MCVFWGSIPSPLVVESRVFPHLQKWNICRFCHTVSSGGWVLFWSVGGVAEAAYIPFFLLPRPASPPSPVPPSVRGWPIPGQDAWARPAPARPGPIRACFSPLQGQLWSGVSRTTPVLDQFSHRSGIGKRVLNTTQVIISPSSHTRHQISRTKWTASQLSSQKRSHSLMRPNN